MPAEIVPEKVRGFMVGSLEGSSDAVLDMWGAVGAFPALSMLFPGHPVVETRMECSI